VSKVKLASSSSSSSRQQPPAAASSCQCCKKELATISISHPAFEYDVIDDTPWKSLEFQDIAAVSQSSVEHQHVIVCHTPYIDFLQALKDGKDEYCALIGKRPSVTSFSCTAAFLLLLLVCCRWLSFL